MVGETTKLTADYMQEEYVKKYCKFLKFLASFTMVQLCIEDYPEDMAAVDIIHDQTDVILDGTGLTLEQFLVQFKKHNNLAVLPPPTCREAEQKPEFIYFVNKINTENVVVQEESNQANRGVLAIEMDTSSSRPNVGGRVAMVRKVMQHLHGLLIDPFQAFNSKKTLNDQSARFSAYAEKMRQEDKADRCAEILSSIPPVDNPTLKGAAKKAADERITPLERRVQSLEDQTKNYHGSKRNNAAVKQTKSCGKSKTKNNSNKGKGGNDQGGSSKGSKKGKGNKGKSHSATKSNTNSRKSRTDRRK